MVSKTRKKSFRKYRKQKNKKTMKNKRTNKRTNKKTNKRTNKRTNKTKKKIYKNRSKNRSKKILFGGSGSGEITLKEVVSVFENHRDLKKLIEDNNAFILLLRYHMKHFHGIDIPEAFQIDTRNIFEKLGVFREWVTDSEYPVDRNSNTRPFNAYYMCLLLLIECLYFQTEYQNMAGIYIEKKRRAQGMAQEPRISCQGKSCQEVDFPSYWVDANGDIEETEGIAEIAEYLNLTRQIRDLEVLEGIANKFKEPTYMKDLYTHLVAMSGIDFKVDDSLIHTTLYANLEISRDPLKHKFNVKSTEGFSLKYLKDLVEEDTVGFTLFRPPRRGYSAPVEVKYEVGSGNWMGIGAYTATETFNHRDTIKLYKVTPILGPRVGPYGEERLELGVERVRMQNRVRLLQEVGWFHGKEPPELGELNLKLAALAAEEALMDQQVPTSYVGRHKHETHGDSEVVEICKVGEWMDWVWDWIPTEFYGLKAQLTDITVSTEQITESLRALIQDRGFDIDLLDEQVKLIARTTNGKKKKYCETLNHAEFEPVKIHEKKQELITILQSLPGYLTYNPSENVASAAAAAAAATAVAAAPAAATAAATAVAAAAAATAAAAAAHSSVAAESKPVYIVSRIPDSRLQLFDQKGIPVVEGQQEKDDYFVRNLINASMGGIFADIKDINPIFTKTALNIKHHPGAPGTHFAAAECYGIFTREGIFHTGIPLQSDKYRHTLAAQFTVSNKFNGHLFNPEFSVKHIKNFQLWGQYNGHDLPQQYKGMAKDRVSAVTKIAAGHRGHQVRKKSKKSKKQGGGSDQVSDQGPDQVSDQGPDQVSDQEPQMSGMMPVTIEADWVAGSSQIISFPNGQRASIVIPPGVSPGQVIQVPVPSTAPPAFSDKMLEPFVINADENELWLFHGTNFSSVSNILQTNFREPEQAADARHGGLYGKYCYFTNHLCKALQYSEPFEYRIELLFLYKDQLDGRSRLRREAEKAEVSAEWARTREIGSGQGRPRGGGSPDWKEVQKRALVAAQLMFDASTESNACWLWDEKRWLKDRARFWLNVAHEAQKNISEGGGGEGGPPTEAAASSQLDGLDELLAKEGEPPPETDTVIVTFKHNIISGSFDGHHHHPKSETGKSSLFFYRIDTIDTIDEVDAESEESFRRKFTVDFVRQSKDDPSQTDFFVVQFDEHQTRYGRQCPKKHDLEEIQHVESRGAKGWSRQCKSCTNTVSEGGTMWACLTCCQEAVDETGEYAICVECNAGVNTFTLDRGSVYLVTDKDISVVTGNPPLFTSIYKVDCVCNQLTVQAYIRSDTRWPVFLSRVRLGNNPFTTHNSLLGVAGVAALETLDEGGIKESEDPVTAIFAQGAVDARKKGIPITSKEPETTETVGRLKSAGALSIPGGVEWWNPVKTSETLCSNKGFGDKCLLFNGTAPDKPYISFYNRKDNQGQTDLNEHKVLKTKDMQIHNEFMVAQCSKNVYSEYLLLFKFAPEVTLKDMEDMEGYGINLCIYKPPEEYRPHPEMYLRYLTNEQVEVEQVEVEPAGMEPEPDPNWGDPDGKPWVAPGGKPGGDPGGKPGGDPGGKPGGDPDEKTWGDL
jgi:hypothetical protein